MQDRSDILAACLLRIETEGLPALEAACTAHPEHAEHLRRRVAQLRELGLLSLAGAPADPAPPERLPAHIGNYRVESVLGHGGMGTVYLAEQLAPVRRSVAVKVVKAGMDSRRVLARFDQERQALALMSHPSIAQVYDAGVTDEGRPYFVMELVEGTPLTRYCSERRLPIGDRLELFVQVCHAVDHAHRKGVVHRDLKPSNILVGARDGGHFAKLIDFGLARATAPDRAAQSLFTEEGVLIGTPEYMSPEQAAGAREVDARTDVYSLGVILYELVTGVLPFPSDELRNETYLEIVRTLRDEEPPLPSAHRASVRGELDWIIMRAIAKEPERRYPTAAAFARDVERFLADEPVEAGPPSLIYRLRTRARKHRAAVVAVLSVAVTAVVGGLLARSYALEVDSKDAAVRAQRARFDHLALMLRVDRANEGAAGMLPAWPERAMELRDWLVHVGRPLADELEGVRAAVADTRFGADALLTDGLRRGHESLERFVTETLVDVEERLSWAERVESATLGHPRARVTWDQARAAVARADGVVASRAYARDSIELRPQTGLVPIGMNPVTELWEFYHLRSAFDSERHRDPAELDVPSHDGRGRIEVGDDTGIVFVLLPGGTFTMGAQRSDPDAPHYSADADPREQPPHDVTLRPFFLARHETTQGQWVRLQRGDNPSRAQPGKHWPGNPGPVTWHHPVEQVSWPMARDVLARHGLVLPTEAQWEYACRAGTHTQWYVGEDPLRLAAHENLADLALRRVDAVAPIVEFDDGWGLGSSPVGIYAPNPFGLHDMHGNLNEWCREPSARYTEPTRGDEGERPAPEGPATGFVVRGGSCITTPDLARSATRARYAPQSRNYYLGVRASRRLYR